MKKIEDWFLDQFMPWLNYVARYVGILVIEGGLAYVLNFCSPLGFAQTFIAVFLVCGLIYLTAKEKRFKRRLDDLLNDELDKILSIVKGDAVYSSALDIIVSKIARILYEEGFEDTIHEKDGIRNTVKERVHSKYFYLKGINI